jgi:hypothetical protein
VNSVEGLIKDQEGNYIVDNSKVYYGRVSNTHFNGEMNIVQQLLQDEGELFKLYDTAVKSMDKFNRSKQAASENSAKEAKSID